MAHVRHFLEFEKPVAELEGKIEELRHVASDGEVNIEEEIGKLQTKVERQLKASYAKLTAWQKTLVARHPERPHFGDYVDRLIDDFTPLAGDRNFGEDSAVIGGLGRFEGRTIMLIGTEKGNDTESRVKHRFGAGNPEGYRKARRLMEMADRFSVPVLTLVDTAGAYPGIEAEQHGQAQAIASCIETCLAVRVPLISVIIGEGGSGGAIALAVGNQVLMLEHSIYSVISPEGCASILWRSGDQAQEAADNLKLTAQDLLELKVIDDIIQEPLGGAHREPDSAIDAVGKAIGKALLEVEDLDGGILRARRREKFLALGHSAATH